MSGRPKVVVHVGVSADGATTGFGDFDLGVFYGLCEKAGWHEDIALVGSTTITSGVQTFLGLDPSLADDATVSPSPAPVIAASDDIRPRLVVPDTRGTVKCWNLLRTMPYWQPTMVSVVTDTTPAAHLAYLARVGVDVLRVEATSSGHADVRAMLMALSQRYGAKTIRVDSGGVLIGELLRAGLVDELSIVVYPVLAGSTGKTLLAGTLPTIAKLTLIASEQLTGGLVWLRYTVNH